MVDKQYTWQDVYNTAGENLAKKLLALNEDRDSLIKWFYEPNKALKGKSPNEFCLEGKNKELEKKVMDILTAAQGA